MIPLHRAFMVWILLSFTLEHTFLFLILSSKLGLHQRMLLFHLPILFLGLFCWQFLPLWFSLLFRWGVICIWLILWLWVIVNILIWSTWWTKCHGRFLMLVPLLHDWSLGIRFLLLMVLFLPLIHGVWSCVLRIMVGVIRFMSVSTIRNGLSF